MKVYFFTTTMLVLACNALFAQDKVIKINTIKDKEALLKAIYVYPDFTEGRVHLKDNSTVEARLNYNRLNNEILFIDDKKDTLALSSPETTDNIIIGSDIYFYVSGAYVKQLTAYPTINLVQKSRLQYIGTEKKADGYGSYSNASANESISNVKNGVQSKIGVDENQTYTLSDTYYLFAPSKSLLPANKKNFLKSFSKHEKELNDYIGTNNIGFEKREELEKLLQYAQSFN
jgi:hypothetical protein